MSDDLEMFVLLHVNVLLNSLESKTVPQLQKLDCILGRLREDLEASDLVSAELDADLVVD